MPYDDLTPALIAHLFASGALDDKDMPRLNRARIGGTAFGAPQLPQLPPLHPSAELTAGAPKSIAEYVQRSTPYDTSLDKAGDIARDYATGGYHMLDTGMRHLAEATPGTDPREWDYAKAAGGLGEGAMGGMAMLPGGGPVRTLFGTVPRTIATSTAMGLAPMAGEGQFSKGIFSTPAEAATKKQTAPAAPSGPPPDDGLSDQQRTRRDELNRKQDKDGYLPKAEREELQGINKLSADYAREQNATRLRTEGAEKEAASKRRIEEANREAERKAFEEQRSHTFAGRHPYMSLGMQVAGSGLGAALGSYLKYRGGQNYTANINNLMERIAESVQGAQRAAGRRGPQALARADRLTQQAQTLQEQANAQRPHGRYSPLGMSLLGTEIGSGMPAVIDKTTEGKNPDWGQTATRFGLGALGGAPVGEFAGMAVPNPNRPPGYAAEIAALRAAIDARRRRRP